MIDNVPLTEKKTTNKPQLILSDFQSVTRDFAFILDKDVKSSDLIEAALNVDTKIIKSAEIFVFFEEKSLGNDKKSMETMGSTSKIEQEPKLEGRQFTMIFTPN